MHLADELECILSSRMAAFTEPKPARPRAIAVLCAALLTVIAGTTITAVVLTHSLIGGLTVLPDVVDATAQPESGALNVLLLGVDGSAPDDSWANRSTGVRSDTAMLVHVPADRSSVQIVSLMRDTWVEVPGHGSAKLNAAFSWGGARLAVRTVENLLAVQVDHVAVVDFAGLGEFADALGGVPVESPKAFRSRNMPGFSYKAGPNVLEGDRAVAFVRERYSFEDADFQRVRNQASFVRGAVDRLHEVATDLDLPKFVGVVQRLSSTAAVDAGLSPLAAARIGWSLREVDGSAVSNTTLPTAGTATRQGQSVVMQDNDGVARLTEAIRDDRVADFIRREGSST
ncbi:LCP family protein [Curtobacterium pusillum]|uniref:LCP family protein n=1 Tax=Curtobacterium pusillum TaxID=69373 RepID=UPI0011A2BBEC|nr:LCP family protein [Curtobacterium pusillum]